MAGIRWSLSDRWNLDLEARYVSASDIDFDYEEGPVGGSLTADYDLFTIGAGLQWRF